jgi:hypothetical protein
MDYENYTFWDALAHPEVKISGGPGCGINPVVSIGDPRSRKCPTKEEDCRPLGGTTFPPLLPPYPLPECYFRDGNMHLGVQLSFTNRSEILAWNKAQDCTITLKYPFQGAAAMGYSLGVREISGYFEWDVASGLAGLNLTGVDTVAMGEAQSGTWYSGKEVCMHLPPRVNFLARVCAVS